MNLSQHEQFFKKHFDSEVRSRGLFMIELVNQLQIDLLLHTWASTPTVQGGRGRIGDLILRALLFAIDRHGGNKMEAAKWIGLSRESVYRILRRWNKNKPKIVYETIHSNLIVDCDYPINSVPDSTRASSRK